MHTIAASLLQDKSKVHHFDDIGYKHSSWDHCPADGAYHDSGRCDCNPSQSFDRHSWSCLNLWWASSDGGCLLLSSIPSLHAYLILSTAEGYPSYAVP